MNHAARRSWRAVGRAKRLIAIGIGLTVSSFLPTSGQQALASQDVRSEVATQKTNNDGGTGAEHEYHWSETNDPLLECYEAVALTTKDPAQGIRERQKLEAHLLQNGSDLDARIRVIGLYYGAPDSVLQERRAAHLHWLIANHPEINLSGFGTLDPGTDDDEKASRLWADALEKNQGNLAVVMNAGEAFLRIDPELALEAFAKGAAAEPAKPDWHSELARAWQYSVKRHEDSGEQRRRLRAALHERELALSFETVDFRVLDARIEVARAAVAAEDFGRAREAATQALADAPRFKGIYVAGNAIHWGHIVLGEVALARGATPEAAAQLTLAGRTPGSPQLSSFGPDFELAAKLVKAGQPQAVIGYLKDCGKFWSGHEQLIGDWILAIQRGDHPDFKNCQ